MVKRVVSYQASDNSIHATQKEAKEHDMTIATMNALKAILATGIAAWRVDAIVGNIVHEADEVINALKNYKKAIGRKNNSKRVDNSVTV